MDLLALSVHPGLCRTYSWEVQAPDTGPAPERPTLEDVLGLVGGHLAAEGLVREAQTLIRALPRPSEITVSPGQHLQIEDSLARHRARLSVARFPCGDGFRRLLVDRHLLGPFVELPIGNIGKPLVSDSYPVNALTVDHVLSGDAGRASSEGLP